MILRGLLFIALLPFVGRGQDNGDSLVTSYSGTDTGLHTISFGTAQDAQGILYFASTALLTFDGDHWKRVPLADSFAIRGLTFGPGGRLWAAMMGDLGWFEQTPSFTWEFRSLREKLPVEAANIGEVWGVSADPDGATFVSLNRVLRWDGTQFVTWLTTAEGKLYPIRSNGRFFVHHPGDGLYELDTHGPRLVINRKELNEATVQWVERRASDWVLGTSKGFFTYDGTTLARFAPALDEFLQTGKLSKACRLPDGRIAVGTVKNGLAFLRADGSVDSFLGNREGIPSPYVTSLFVSRDGELWVTTGSHILRIDIRARSTVFDRRAGLPRQTYRKITKANGSIFVANESGVYQLPAEGRDFIPIDSLAGRWHSLRGTAQGLLVTGFQGAALWNEQIITTLHATKYDVTAVTACRDNPADMFLADNLSLIRRFADKSFQPLVRGLPDLATSIAEDLSGRIWIGTLAKGVVVATPEADTVVEASPTTDGFGLPKLVGPTHVRTNPAGIVMVFANNGAWVLPSSDERFRPVSNFPVRNIAAVSDMDDEGNVWVALENTETLAPCVGRISSAQLEFTWKPHAVDGLLDVGSPRSIYAESTKRQETVLWIGGTDALLRHVVAPNASPAAPRSPLLRGFVRNAIDGSRESISAALPYSTELVEFEFAAPEFSHRSLLRIETRIEGIDHDWTPVAPGSRRELTAIRDGHYTVKARVVAETGVASKETTFSFEVLPPFWRTPPFIFSAALMLGPLGFGIYLLRIRTLRRRNAELEQKVQERTEELVAANAAKTQFVANMSHDIRNPLNGIVGLALALEDTRLDHRQREIVSTLRECTTYLSSLVDDVLDFASIEAGRVELRPRAYGPQELLQSIVETLKSDATASGAVLSAHVDDGVPTNLFGDAGRIQQILVNFVSNALKYAGGNIRLAVHAPINSPGEIEFAVTDNGPGLSPKEQTLLFTKFTRLRQQRGGEEIPGTGLGLAACRLLADIMGGSVGVESATGEGARFHLRLPLTLATEPVAAPSAHLPNTAVLLVEDTDYNAWAATAVLAKLGLSCERARTGEEALRLFAARRFNVVLLDRNLPDMDGTEVARRMREMESDGLQAVLLAVTAYCTAEDRKLCLQSGMDAFVGKPLTPEKLRKVLVAAGRRLLAAASVHALPEQPAAELDLGLLSYLSDGSVEGLEAQTKRFLASLEQAEAELIAAEVARDFKQLAVNAHRLLGQAKMVGGSDLGNAAAELEAAAKSADGPACEKSLRFVRDAIQALTAAMRHRRPAAQSV